MARPSFRDRFFTPPVARAMVSPGGILAAGVAAGASLALGLPILIAPVAAVGAWAARVGLAVPRRSRPERIDPFTLPEPWRQFVIDARAAERRFAGAVATADRGPVRERLEEIGVRVTEGVEEVWRIARRGAALVTARAHVDVSDADRRLAEIERARGERPLDETLDRTEASLRSQLDTARRLDETIEATHTRLRLLDELLDEAVARAAELSVSVSDAGQLAPLGDDVEGVVTEMEALRRALEEVGTDPGPGLGRAGAAGQ